MSGWFGSIGGLLYSAWGGIYNLVTTGSTASAPASSSASSLLGGSATRTAALTAGPRKIEYPATNLPPACIAGALTYITPDDTAAVALTLGQSNSVMRDRTAPYVFAQLHNVVRFARASPEQSEHVLSVFSKSRPSAKIDTLALREVRAEPLPALTTIVHHRPLQLTTLDIYKSDVSKDASAIAAAIAQCACLTSVTLSDCGISSPGVVAAIIPTILTKLPQLKRLDLSNNRMRIDGAVALASQPCFIDPEQMANFELPQLEHLDLGGNALGSRGLETLLRVHFPGKTTPKLELLDVRNNALHDEGSRLVTRCLAEVAMPAATASVAAAGGSGGIRASPVPALNVIEMSENGVSVEAAKAMRKAFPSARVFA